MLKSIFDDRDRANIDRFGEKQQKDKSGWHVIEVVDLLAKMSDVLVSC